MSEENRKSEVFEICIIIKIINFSVPKFNRTQRLYSEIYFEFNVIDRYQTIQQ